MTVTTTDNQEELFIVVSRRDRIIGYRSRYDCHHDKSLIHRGVNVLVFNKLGEMLLQKRSLTKDTFPGWWTTAVGGHVAKGETYRQAAKREMTEEIGISVAFRFHSKFIHEYPRETEIESIYIAKSEGPFLPNRVEVERLEFFSKERLAKYLKTKNFHLTDLALHSLKAIGFIS